MRRLDAQNDLFTWVCIRWGYIRIKVPWADFRPDADADFTALFVVSSLFFLCLRLILNFGF